jgi:hypothetical protein
MTLWKRAPRSVYQVYDEEQYLAGSDLPGSEEIGLGHESQAPTNGSGQIDPGYPKDPGAAPGVYTRQERDGLAERFRQRNSSRVLALGLLSVVTATATGLVALGVSRHSAPPLAPVRRVPVRRQRSEMAAASASTSAVPYRRVVVEPLGPERVASGPMVLPSRRVGTSAHPAAGPPAASIERLAEVVDVARWHATESQPMTAESQGDDEFGFER